MSFETSWELTRLRILMETGWKFEYIDGLSIDDIGALTGYWQGLDAARKKK